MVRTIFLSLVLGVSLACVGCGRGGPERVEVYGTVTYDGQSVGDGEVSFIPKKGTPGSGGASRIVRGEYRVAAKGGLQPGAYQVRIQGYALAPGAEPPPAIIGPNTPRGKPYLPEKYHEKSTLEFTVSGDADPLEKNFELER